MNIGFLRSRLVLCVMCVLLSSTAYFNHAWAHAFTVGDIKIAHPYALETVEGQAVGGVFFKAIENAGTTPDRLINASIDSTLADSAELHVMNTEQDVMRMRRVKAIELPAKTRIPMIRGLTTKGYHVMLMGLKRPLQLGETIKLKLQFKRAGWVDVVVNIESVQAKSAATPATIAPATTHAH
jgi:periplasmic copper chaperone A